MSLILPGSPAFSECTDNLTGTPPAVNVGTNFTAGANSADGTSVSVLSALGHDVHYLVIGIGGVNTNAADSSCLLDILTDPAGGTSWGTWIDDLVCGFAQAPGGGIPFMQVWYHFPIFVKSGTSLGVRARTAHTVNITSGRVAMWAFGCPQRPDMWWCGSRVESLGINAASSKGTTVTPGSTGTFGSWTTIGTSTARYQAIQFQVNGSDATMLGQGYYWQVGAGSTQLRGTPNFFASGSTSEIMGRSFSMPIWCDVPSSTTLQLRATGSGTGEDYNAAVYGVI